MWQAPTSRPTPECFAQFGPGICSHFGAKSVSCAPANETNKNVTITENKKVATGRESGKRIKAVLHAQTECVEQGNIKAFMENV